MQKPFDVGIFDLDLGLKEAALDSQNRATRRMLANASIGMCPYDSYYSAAELHQALDGVHQVGGKFKAKLTRILSCDCDDYQRCLYYCLAGRGVVQMLDDLLWLMDILKARAVIAADLFKNGEFPLHTPAPYVASQPDGPVVSADPNFEEGPSWYLDLELGGVIEE